MIANIERYEGVLRGKLAYIETMLQDPSLTTAEKDILRRQYQGISNKLSTHRSKVLSKLKYRSAGLTKKRFDIIASNPEGNGAAVETALGNAKRYCPKLSQQYNKIRSISVPKTKLGKFLPKATKLGMRGLTFGGGLLNCLLMLGFFMGEPVKTTIEAPKDKKVATGVHGFFDAMSWVIAMPIALKAMHAVNGLKNLGKSKAQVDAFKTALSAFNDKAGKGLFKSHAAYKKELASLMSLKNAGTAPKGLGKLFSKVASFLSIGLEQITPFKRNTANLAGSAKRSALLGNFARKMPNFLKNCVGYPLRFALYCFAFQPVIDKIFSSVISAFVGKPYDPEKAKEEAEQKALREQATNIINPGWFSQISDELSPHAKAGLDGLDMSQISDDNLIKQELAKKGITFPKNKSSNPQQNSYTNSINGVSVTTTNGTQPYMPPNYQDNNGQYTNGGVSVNNNGQKDPNTSDYDTIPLTYQPVIDHNNPIPYGDPGLEQTIQKTNELVQKGNKIAEDIDKLDKKKK